MVDETDLQDGIKHECGTLGRYQGKGRTSVSNWHGKAYTARYCSECDTTYYVADSSAVSPTA